MTKIDWDLTVDTIKDGKCILFLGAELFKTKNNENLNDRLLDYLELDKDPKIRVYNDGLFFFQERQKRTETYLKIRRFYEQEKFPEANEIFRKIARIPFHFIITVTPDNKLVEVYRDLKLKVRPEFYLRKQAADKKAVVPNRQSPLVYNMLGSIESPESLVLTHDDLFDYLESVFQAQSMPEIWKYHIINEAQNIIFLGIPFDRWYMHFLLRILHLHKDEEFMRFAVTQEISEEIQTLCKEEFKINFVPKVIDTFIDEIYTRCEEKGLLKEVDSTQASLIEYLTEQLAKDKIQLVIDQLESFLKRGGNDAKDLLDDLTLLNNRFRRLERKIRQDIIRNENATIDSNKIRKSLLELLQEAKLFE